MPRNVRSFWWWIPLAFALGVAGGYAWGRVFPGTAEKGGMISAGAPLSVGTSEIAAGESSGTQALPDHLDPDSRLGILERLAAANLADLPALSRELLGLDDAFQLMFAVMDRWVELDAPGGFAFFNDRDSGLSGPILDAAAFGYCGRWALVDPDAALGAAEGLEDTRIRDIAMNRISETLALERPSDFFRLLSTLERHEAIKHSISKAARSLALTDPRAAVAAYEALDDEIRSKFGVAADLAAGWAKDDPEGALVFVRALEDEKDRTRALRAVASRLMESDPERAATIYKEGGALGDKNEGAVTSFESGGYLFNFDWPKLALTLSETDPAASIAWVARHFPEEAGRFLYKLLPQDAVAAVEALAALPDAVLKEGKLPNWPTADWRPFGIEAALARLPQITDPVKRESLHAWLLGAQAVGDPGTAIIAATRDLSDPANRAHVLQQGMATWAREDLTGASQWLATRPQGTETDAAIVSLVEVAWDLEPDSALSWAGTISEEKARREQIAMVYRVWQSRDEEAARAAVEAMALDEGERAKLREMGLGFLKR